MKLQIKLKSLTLENFRLFEKLEMDFHPQLTVLIGENGAGKTALVEGIAKMLIPIPDVLENPNLETNKGLFQKKTFNAKDIRFGQLMILNEIQLVISNDEKESVITWEAKVGKDTDIQFGGMRLAKFLTFSTEVLSKRRQGNILSSIPIIVYYPCEKVDNENSNGEEKGYAEKDVFNAYDNALNARSFDFPRFFEWYKWQEDREVRGRGSKTLNIVRQAILAMLNDEGEEEKFTDIFVDVSSFSNYRLKLKKGDAELEVSQLSAGEKSLFALVSDIARRLSIANPRSEDPLKEGSGVVLIDEIDLHLHPRWQRKIVGKLTEIFPKIQFVITTHSPIILGSVRSENVRLLDDGQVFSVPETLGQSIGMIVKQIMGVEESLFENDMRHIFRLLAKNKINEAKAGIAAIENKSPAEIPALTEAKAVLKRKEILSQ